MIHRKHTHSNCINVKYISVNYQNEQNGRGGWFGRWKQSYTGLWHISFFLYSFLIQFSCLRTVLPAAYFVQCLRTIQLTTYHNFILFLQVSQLILKRYVLANWWTVIESACHQTLTFFSKETSKTHSHIKHKLFKSYSRSINISVNF